MREDALHIALDDVHRLHLRRFTGDDEGPVVFLLHGAIENGRIFYSRSGKGFAPWLAEQGFDVFVADLRGRGDSRPRIARGADHDQTDAILEDLPAFSDFIAECRPGAQQHWIAHSWGGVLMASTLARLPRYRKRVASLCFFGTKRAVRVWNPTRVLYVDLIWCGLCRAVSLVAGYLPARGMRIGAENESRGSHAQGAAWVRARDWVDPRDGFDYAAVLQDVELPPAWFLAGANDPALGHPDDVKRFMAECGPGEQHYTLLSRDNGHARDYGHIDMLTAPEGKDDHFPEVVAWLRKHEGE